jgi:phage N-6-adenine-methyltransferase
MGEYAPDRAQGQDAGMSQNEIAHHGIANLSLSMLLSRAGQRLLDARSSGEVFEAKKIAEMALHLAKVTHAANETHADCLRVITRAEVRMADEIDRGQEAGEVAKAGGDRTIVRSEDNGEVTFGDLGISRQRVSEWREIRDAGEDAVEQAIKATLDEGRAPTKEDIKRAVKNPHVRGTFGTGENEWYTPAEIIHDARAVLEVIDLDPASSDQAQRNVQARQYFTLKDDGLAQPWFGNVWLNPPYAQPFIQYFTDKMIAEVDARRVTSAIILTHNYTDTAWFQKLARKANAVCFPKGRIRFEAPDGTLAAPTQGQTFFYFGTVSARFVEVFSARGVVGVLQHPQE